MHMMIFYTCKHDFATAVCLHVLICILVTTCNNSGLFLLFNEFFFHTYQPIIMAKFQHDIKL
jgi:hypothetical protein